MNATEMKARGREVKARGKRNGATKLTAYQVRGILRSKASGRALARKHGVSKTAIYAIRKGITWRHVTL